MNRLKEYFSKKTDKEIFAILLFFSCLILMTVLAVFRFCGIGYFANEYEEQELIQAVKAIEAKRAEMKAKGQEVPAYMQTMWDEEHAEYVEKVAKLKYALETAKK